MRAATPPGRESRRTPRGKGAAPNAQDPGLRGLRRARIGLGGNGRSAGRPDAGRKRQQLLHPDWGQSNTQYLRVAAANYADGRGRPISGPPTRFVSNRIFNDVHNNVFSENDISHWGFTWGQFMDHTFGLRQEVGGENAPIPFSRTDPIEEFVNDFG